MNCLNDSSVKTRARARARIGAEIRAGTSLGPGVELQDGAGEILPE